MFDDTKKHLPPYFPVLPSKAGFPICSLSWIFKIGIGANRQKRPSEHELIKDLEKLQCYLLLNYSNYFICVCGTIIFPFSAWFLAPPLTTHSTRMLVFFFVTAHPWEKWMRY